MKKTINYFFALLLLVAASMTVITACSDNGTSEPEPVLSSDSEIKSFSFQALSPAVTASVSGTSVLADVSYQVDVTSLVPTITVAATSTVTPASGVAQDFSSPVTYTVTAEDASTTVYTVTVTKLPPPTLAISPIWERTLASGGIPSWFTANNDRDLTVAGDYVYVVNNVDKIRVMDIATGNDASVKDTLTFIDGKQNFASGNLFLVGAAGDNSGRIIGTNLRVGNGTNPVYFYKWENKDADQELLFEFVPPSGARLGDNVTVNGDVSSTATVYAPASGTNIIYKFDITGGTVNTTPTEIALADVTNIGNAPDVSPVTSASDANIIVTGTGLANIAEYTVNGELVGKLPEELNTGETAFLFTYGLDAKAFEIDDRKVVAVTATDFTANAANIGKVFFIDYTDGWENITADNIKSFDFTPDGNIDTNFNGTGGVDVVVNGSTANVYALITNFGVAAMEVSFQ
jgi:hypothetical protein